MYMEWRHSTCNARIAMNAYAMKTMKQWINVHIECLHSVCIHCTCIQINVHNEAVNQCAHWFQWSSESMCTLMCTLKQWINVHIDNEAVNQCHWHLQTANVQCTLICTLKTMKQWINVQWSSESMCLHSACNPCTCIQWSSESMCNELNACAMNACGMKTLYTQSPYCSERMWNDCNEAMNACEWRHSTRNACGMKTLYRIAMNACAVNACGMKTLYMQWPYCSECIWMNAMKQWMHVEWIECMCNENECMCNQGVCNEMKAWGMGWLRSRSVGSIKF